jgi:hypothetical protein
MTSSKTVIGEGNMSKYNEPLALLEDLRARVIYYSCLAKPKNILEISKLWDYKTSTYFYQEQSKKVIEEMVSKKIVTMVEGSCFKSNYDLLVDKKGAIEFFERANSKISNEIIIEKYDYEVTEGQLEDRLFKEFCIEKKPGLKAMLDAIAIVGKEIDSFLSLWETSLFREIFLSADVIRKLISDRQELPKDPRELLFGITTDTCEKMYDYKEGGSELTSPYHLDLWLSVDEALPLLFTMVKSANENYLGESKILHQQLKGVYQIMKEKFAIYRGRSEISAYHVAKIVEIIGL